MNHSHNTSGEPIRLFTEKATAVAAAIGGPLPAAYLIARNFKSLGKTRAATITLVIGATITVVLFTTLVLLPFYVVEKIPPHVFSLAYGIVGYFVVKTLQQRDIDAHLQAGGKKGSWQVIVCASIIGLVLTLGFGLLLMSVTPWDAGIFDGERYKLERTGGTIFYDKANIPEADVRFVGNELETMGYFPKDDLVPAAFRKDGQKYIIELILEEKNWDASFVREDITHLLRTLRRWHPDSEFQVRLVAIDFLGKRKTKTFAE